MLQAQLISQYHPMLERIACRIVQSRADAEDILQDTYEKLLKMDLSPVSNIKAYLIRTVVNNCLNHLKALQRKKEEYLEDLGIQEFIDRVKESDFFKFDFQEELSEAFALIQTKLEPLERAVFLLREVFDFDYEALQQLLDKRKDHCRQLFSRARRKLFEETDKISFSLPASSDLYSSFKKACDLGNPSDFIRDLKADISAKWKDRS